MIRVALAEEHRIPRWALGKALAGVADIEVVGEAGGVEQMLVMIRETKPEVLILSGFEGLQQIRELESGPFVIVLAPFDDTAFAARAIAGGAHGYISMSEDPAKLLDAIRAVTHGEQVIPPGVDKLLGLGDGFPGSSLTARELQVMEMLAHGMTNREIAEHLQIRVKTVDTHRSHVLKKLGLRNNSDLTRFAVKHGYVPL